MTFDLDEQEKLDALKDWWKRYGIWLTGALVILAIDRKSTRLNSSHT